MILELVRHGKRRRRHRAVASRDRELPRSHRRGGGRGGPAGPDRSALRRPGRRVGPGRASSASARTTPLIAGLERRHVRRRRRHELALGSRGHGRRRVDVLFVDEAGQLSLATVCSRRRRGPLVRPARRPATSCRRSRRGPTRKAPKRLPSSTSSAERGRSPRTAACSSRRRTACTPRSTPSSPTRSTRAASSRTPRTRFRTSPAGVPVGGDGRAVRRVAACRWPAIAPARRRSWVVVGDRGAQGAGRGPIGRA